MEGGEFKNHLEVDLAGLESGWEEKEKEEERVEEGETNQKMTKL